MNEGREYMVRDTTYYTASLQSLRLGIAIAMAALIQRRIFLGEF